MSRRRNRQPQSELRVIAGQWRGRRIRFNADGIRPTGDRVRETLFNWLTPWLPGARCLDLFAGSGALGIEALSRGAAEVVFIERNPAAARAIQQTLDEFTGSPGDKTGNKSGGESDEARRDGVATVLTADAVQTDIAALGPFDIVFVDPPFAGIDATSASTSVTTSVTTSGLGNLCTLLDNSGGLAAQCHVYLEMDHGVAVPELPAGWQLQREKTAGKVRYALAERNDMADHPAD